MVQFRGNEDISYVGIVKDGGVRKSAYLYKKLIPFSIYNRDGFTYASIDMKYVKGWDCTDEKWLPSLSVKNNMWGVFEFDKEKFLENLQICYENVIDVRGFSTEN